MIRATVELGEGALTRRVRITAPSIEREPKFARAGKQGRMMRLVFPIGPEAFFVPQGFGQREAA